MSSTSSSSSTLLCNSPPSKRKDQDILKLVMSQQFPVNVVDGEKYQEIHVGFKGPSNTAYENGTWQVRVILPPDYPFKSPSIGFINPIFHPNIDMSSGSVCLDVINQTWSPMYSLLNVFEQFLPQLLTYPNPSDPLNATAASMLLRDPIAFDNMARDLVKRHASGKAVEENATPAVRAPTTSQVSPHRQAIADGEDLLGDFEL